MESTPRHAEALSEQAMRTLTRSIQTFDHETALLFC